MGRADGQVSLDEVLLHCSALAHATDLPLNADFENAFADAPADVAHNVALAVDTGVSGLSVEDYAGDSQRGLYDFDLAVARVAAARQAIDNRGGGVVLTARSEGFIRGAPDMDETLRRLAAFAAAGADCLYAPGLRSEDQVRTVVQAVAPKPVNILSPGLPVASLEALGDRREGHVHRARQGRRRPAAEPDLRGAGIAAAAAFPSPSQGEGEFPRLPRLPLRLAVHRRVVVVDDVDVFELADALGDVQPRVEFGGLEAGHGLGPAFTGRRQQVLSLAGEQHLEALAGEAGVDVIAAHRRQRPTLAEPREPVVRPRRPDHVDVVFHARLPNAYCTNRNEAPQRRRLGGGFSAQPRQMRGRVGRSQAAHCQNLCVNVSSTTSFNRIEGTRRV
jgi:hypothetical protein